MTTLFSDDFESYALGSGGNGIDILGDWIAVEGVANSVRVFTDGSYKYAGTTLGNHILYSADTTISTADYEVSSTLHRPSSGSIDRKGVAARIVDANNKYFCWYYEGAGEFQLYKEVSGSWNALGAYSYTFTTGTSVKLRLRCDGTTISVYLNSDTSPVISVTDSEFSSAGDAGLCAYTINQYDDGDYDLSSGGLFWNDFSIDDLGAASGTTYQVAALDGVSLSESTSITTIIQGAAIDGVDFVDSPLFLLSIQGTVEDGVSLSESLAATFSIQYTVVDGVLLSDSTFVTLTIHSTVVDGVIISDLAGASLTMPVQVSDSIVSSDGVNGTLTLSVSAVDGFAMSDDGSATMVISATAIDGVGFSDYPAGNCTFVVSAQDGSVLSELASVVVAGDYPVIVTMEVTSKASGMTFSAASGSMMFSAKRTFNN